MEESGLLPSKISILLSMWRLKAIGERSVSTEALRMRLQPEYRSAFGASIQNLKESMLVVSAKKNDQELLSMTPLGVAFLREFEGIELERMGKKG